MPEQPRKPRFSAEKRALLARKLAGSGLAPDPAARIAPRARRGEAAPLSAGQERIWLAEQMLAGAPVYHVPLAAHLLGPLDTQALQRALVALAERHELLRTRFVQEGDHCLAQPLHALELGLEPLDLSLLASDARYAHALELAQTELRRPFALAQEPPMRAALWRLGPEEHLLLVTLHHIACDGETIGILCADLARLYQAEREGRTLEAPELQHADFALWQREQQDSAAVRADLEHWQEHLRGPLPVLELPADRPRPARLGHAGAWCSRTLASELGPRLETLQRSAGVTSFQLFLAAFQAWLWRMTGEPELLVGIPFGLRDRPELERLPGFLVNTLVLRTRLSGTLSFRELLGHVQAEVLEATSHGSAPFERVLERLGSERNPGRTPLFQVMFDQRAGLARELRLAGLASGRLLREDELHSGTAKVDLALYSELHEGRIVLSAEYRSDLFEARTIARWLESLEVLLAGIAADPQAEVDHLPLLTPGERVQLERWAQGLPARDCEATLAERVSAWAARTPECTALECGSLRLSYRELEQRSNRLARRLIELGVARGEPVAVCLPRTEELVLALLAILSAGGAYLPLDPSYPAERLRFMLADSGARVLVASEALLAELPHQGLTVLCPERERAALEQLCPDPLEPRSGPDDPAYLIYTSGSTGVPKGVACPQRGVLRLFAPAGERGWLELDERVRMLHLAPESFDASVLDLWAPLVCGGTLVLHAEQKPTLAGLARAVEQHAIDTLFLTTALFHALVDEAPEVLDRLRQVATGGEALSPAHLARARARRPDLRIANCYGPTEATVIASTWVAPAELPSLASVPIGRPIAGTSTHVLDGRLQPVPIGVAGELFVGGPAIALGYWQAPERTAERFLSNPFGPGRLYRSGDRVRWTAAGELEFLGRADEQVKLNGLRIEPGEIEARLAEHARVRRALVHVHGDGSARRLVAYVVPEPGVQLAAAELREHLAQRLPEYLRPSAFVLLDELPLTPGGKIDRARLPAPGAPASLEAEGRDQEPRGELEQLLAAQWCELLGCERVGRQDDFFAQGGHSLLATVLAARVRRLFGVELPLSAFFRERTLAGLARLIESQRSGTLPTAPARRAHADRAPLSFNQRGLWFLQQLAPQSAFYNVPFAIPLRGALDADALERALATIVQRHEILRTTFPLEPVRSRDGQPGWEPVQSIGEPRFALERRELAEHELAPALEAFAREPFDLAHGPLFRALLARSSEREATLALNLHHAVFDGWSLDVLLDELEQLYGAFAAGRPDPLPPLALQYGDHASWQREHEGDERERAELAFWKEELAGAPLVLELPGDRPRPAQPSWQGARVCRRLPRAEVERLRALARSEGATTFLAGLALTEILLARTTGCEDFLVGTPVAARTNELCERSIGLFLNVLPIRADLSGEPGFRQLLARTRERVLRAHAHGDVPFERLVEALELPHDPAHTPVYQVLFSLRRTPRARAAAGLAFAPAREIDAATAKTDLAITLDEEGADLWLDLCYATDLFRPETMERLAERFEHLLAAAVADPGRSVWELEWFSPEERALVLERWSGTSAPYPRDEALATLFERSVQRTPEAPALLHGERVVSYRELDVQANRLARRLIELGVERGSRVAVALERSSELIVALLAILKAGGAYVPLDPGYPRERLAFMLEDAGATVLLCTSALREALPGTALPPVLLDQEREVLAALEGSPLPARASGADLAYVMYTSGSTGRPKGVLVPQRAVSRLVFGANYARIDASCTFLQLAPISFDASTLEIWGALLHGGRLVLHPEGVPTARGLAEAVERHGVTTLWLTAALFNALVDEDPTCLHGLRECLTGGEALSLAHVRRAQEHLPASVQLVNGYGPTENTTFTCCHRIPRPLPDDLASIPIGVPITNTRVYVVDRRLRPVPVGVPGELVTGGEGLALGYHARPELTRERFVANPFGPGELYRTGDLVRWLPDGTLEFLGRSDDQVKIRGHRIEPGEIAALLGTHPSVRKAFVTVHEDPAAGKRLVAYLELQGADPGAAELARWLGQRLPDYMIPAAFSTLEALPMNPNGKVDRQRLPAPSFEGKASERPRNELEGLLASVWQRVLGLEQVGPHDDFFELGGHSLLAVKLVQEIRDVFGQELELSSLVSAATVAEQAQLLHRGVGSARSSPLVKLQPRGTRPPVFCVCSLGGTVLNQRPLALCLGPEQPFYGLQAVDLEPRLGRPARIEDYAAAYVEAMKSVAPRGPYVIGGHSFGGIVSYEIAQQLTGRGDEVAMLFILDSSLPNLDRGVMDRLAGLLAFVRGLPYVPAEALAQVRRDPGELARTLRQKLRFVRGKTRGRPAASTGEGGDPIASQVAGIVEMTNWPENNRRIAERHWRAVLEYVPRPYPGRITLFRSRFQSPFLGLGRKMGWDRVALGGVEVVPVPGGHLSVLQPPNVDVLACKLAARLARRRRAA